MNKFPLTWVIVADGARARIFAWATVNGELEEVVDLTNPQGRLRERALTSDRPGTTFDSHGHNSGHPMQMPHSAQDNAADTFAHEVSIELKSALDGGRYTRLVLIAPPKFLGHLRSHLDKQVGKKVVESLPLDLTRETPDAIKARLPMLSGSVP